MSNYINQFEPHPLIRGGILQTVAGTGMWGKTNLPRRIRHEVKTGPYSLLVLLELVAPDSEKPIVLLAHGMGGCSESGYMKRIAGKLHAMGYGVYMMNHRGSGPGIGISNSLWHGGSSGDLEKVVQTITTRHPGQPLLLIGFSLSGNILLKYLGEGRIVPSVVAAALAVNPPVDLRTASLLLSREKCNRIFNWYFMKFLNSQAIELARAYPNAFHAPRGLKTIWEFDAAYTAPAAGYRNEEEYYQKCSSSQFLNNIQLPTTILCAKDDPFIPPEVFENVYRREYIRYIAPNAGGHMGYFSKNNIPDRCWMDYFVLKWAAARS